MGARKKARSAADAASAQIRRAIAPHGKRELTTSNSRKKKRPVAPPNAALAARLIAGSTFLRSWAVEKALSDARRRFPEVMPAIDALSTILVDIETKTSWTLLGETYQRLKRKDTENHAVNFKTLRSILSNSTSQILRLHEYFSLLPTTESPPVLFRLLKRSFPSATQSISPIVLLIPDLLSCYEFDLNGVLRGDPVFSQLAIPRDIQRSVIRLPVADGHSPLLWAVLAHEFGHALAQEREADHRAAAEACRTLNVPSTDPALPLILRYCSEFLADAIAFRGLGPASLLGLIRFESQMLSMDQALPVTTQSHPSTKSRIAYLRSVYGDECMKAFDNTISAYESARSLIIEDSPKRDAATKWETHVETTYFPAIQKAVTEELNKITDLPTFDADNLRRARRLEDRLKRGLPLSAVRELEKDVLRKKFDDALASTDPSAMSNAVRLLRDSPALPSEVLTAGYLRLETQLDRTIDEVLSSSPTDARASNWKEALSAVFAEAAAIAPSLAIADLHQDLAAAAREGKELGPLTLSGALGGDAGTTSAPESASMLSGLGIIRRMTTEHEERRIYVTPLVDPETQVGPASIDVRLGPRVILFDDSAVGILDPLDDEEECRRQLEASARTRDLSFGKPLILHPGRFALASTLEFVSVPADVAARVEGRSSYGRTGLIVHATAGFIDPGFAGHVTLELANHGSSPLKLYPGIRIGQLAFFSVGKHHGSYRSKSEHKYQNSMMAMASKFYEDREYRWMRLAKKKT